VLVDEAQDLSPMQWRMLARRCPSGSMTIVGDFGQSSRPGAARDWDEVLAMLPGRQPPRTVTLSVNYRTPAEVMEVAHRVLAAAAPGVEPTRAVRRTGVAPRFEAVAMPDVVEAVETAAREAAAAEGTVAIVAPREVHGVLVQALDDLHAVADSVELLDAPIAILTATDVKGLEFDHVIVVEPGRLVDTDAAGLRLLYVVLTRATRTLTVVHAEALPAVLTDAAPVGAGAPVAAS
jgi:DNA helicase IV